jgi:hypothetical protein
MPSRPLYSVHPGVAYISNILANFKTRTGRTVDEWIALVETEGPRTAPERRTWLTEKHQLGTNYAWWIAQRAEGKGDDDGDPDAYLRKAPEYVAEMFSGKRAALKPVYDRLLRLGLAAGKDAKAVSSPRSSRRHTRASTLAWRSGRFPAGSPPGFRQSRDPGATGSRTAFRLSRSIRWMGSWRSG